MKKIALIIAPLLLSGCISLDGYLPGTGFSPLDFVKLVLNKVANAVVNRESDKIEIPLKGIELVDKAIAQDEIPLDDIVWLDKDVSKWPITHALSVRIRPGVIEYNTTAVDEWPQRYLGDIYSGGNLVANSWILIPDGDKYYALTTEWLKAGQKSKHIDTIKGDHLNNNSRFPRGWKPTPGVTYGVSVSALARNGASSIEARCPIVLVVWPK